MIKVVDNIYPSGHEAGNVYDTDGESPTLKCNGPRANLKKASPLIQVKSATKDGFETAQPGDSINLSMPNSKTRRGRVGVGVGVAQTLDTQANQSVIVAQRGRGEKGKISQQLEANTTNTTNTLTGVQKDNMLLEGMNIRRLTEIECEKLQGFLPDWTKYGNFDGVIKEISRTQRYKMCGNAVTVDVVELVGKKLLDSI